MHRAVTWTVCSLIRRLVLPVCALLCILGCLMFSKHSPVVVVVLVWQCIIAPCYSACTRNRGRAIPSLYEDHANACYRTRVGML